MVVPPHLAVLDRRVRVRLVLRRRGPDHLVVLRQGVAALGRHPVGDRRRQSVIEGAGDRGHHHPPKKADVSGDQLLQVA